MVHHVKELHFNARVSRPNEHFARLLHEQFGGPNRELKAALQYFVQAIGCRKEAPDKYDMLMDIATEEFGHLEIVGATIQMLLKGVNGDFKNAVDESDLTAMLYGSTARDNYIHEAMENPQFFISSSETPLLNNSKENPLNAAYIMGMGNLTADLRLNLNAETSAKRVYENLIKFTDDIYVKESLQFLMTREMIHFQRFQAALNSPLPDEEWPSMRIRYNMFGKLMSC